MRFSLMSKPGQGDSSMTFGGKPAFQDHVPKNETGPLQGQVRFWMGNKTALDGFASWLTGQQPQQGFTGVLVRGSKHLAAETSYIMFCRELAKKAPTTTMFSSSSSCSFLSRPEARTCVPGMALFRAAGALAPRRGVPIRMFHRPGASGLYLLPLT